jgi:hypothetical protein
MKTRRARKFLVSALASMTVGLCCPAAAQAQTVLSTFFNFGGVYWERGSYDGGAHWFGWGALPTWDGCMGTNVQFDGPISVVADQDHSLGMVAKTTAGFIVHAWYDGGSHQWTNWCTIIFQGAFRAGGAWINGRFYTWLPGSSPVISSWGPLRWDMWLVARRDDGALTFLHGYTPNQFTLFNWETLGTGLFSGTPAVTSWGPGRIDVFVRAADNGLVHKWFDRGRWSSGWEDMGAYVITNPTVSSQQPGQLDVFVGGGDRALWQQTFANGTWSGWFSRGGVLQDGTSPAATSAGPGNVEVFWYGTDGRPRQHSFNWGSWVTRIVTEASARDGFAIHWVP